MGDFKLSAQLVGHDSDVRDLIFPSPELILSASRDHTVRAWRRKASKPPTFDDTIALQIHEYINALALIPPSDEHPEGLIVSGGKDPCLDVRKPTSVSSDNGERILPGHSNNVCVLRSSPNGKYFVSGSWDNTARVWSTQKWETEVMLAGHEGSVWDVLPLSDTLVLTGCADKNIRIYDLAKAVAGEAQPRSTIQTPDVVRGVARLPKDHPTGAEIASSHNDGVIRLWKLTGQQVAELHGHESFVYRLAVLPTGEIVSAGEDRTVRVWRGVECVQTITQPAISVWTVAVCPATGDIATGTSDGVIRVFTRDAERVAAAETVEAFDEAIRSSSIPQQQMGDINKEKLPGPEFLTSKAGTKEGQVQMIREENGSITAHTWSTAAQSWVNVGTVVDAVGSSGRKVEHAGKSYDYVFDVAIEEGQPSLKLPFNLSDNPYDAATKFINDNELSLNYLDQVAQFIIQNTQGATLGQGGDSAGPDPYGTESRYRPGEEQHNYRTRALPQKEYLTITAAKFEPIFKKILSINSALVAAGRKDHSLNPAAQSSLGALRKNLESNQAVDQEDAINFVVVMATQWDYADRLAPLDLLRCVATSPLAARHRSPGGQSLVQLAVSGVMNDVPAGAEPNENMAMMALRTIANLFATAEGAKVAGADAFVAVTLIQRVLGLIGGQPIGIFNRNLKLALGTAAVNYAVLASRQSGVVAKDIQVRLLQALAHDLEKQTDAEVLFRELVAAGTLVTVLGKGEARDLEKATKLVKDRASEVRVKEVADELLGLL